MLALEVIDAVGPGGEFMSHDHTMDHFRQLWSPRLFDRSRLDQWEQRGSKDINARVREKTLALIEEHQVEPLPEDVDRAIEAILTEAGN